MTKEELIKAGYTESQAAVIIGMHKKAIDESFIPKIRFNEINDELKTAKETIVARDGQIETLGKSTGDTEALKIEIKKLQDENQSTTAKYTSELDNTRKLNSLKLKLLSDLDGKPYDVDMVASQFDMNIISLDDNGTIKSGYTEQRETLGKGKSFLFEAAATIPDIKPGTPGWKPVSKTPADGNGIPSDVDVATTYGKSLAAQKNLMNGIVPTTN